jgi:protein SCO1
MSRARRRNASEYRGSAILIAILWSLFGAGFVGCKRQSPGQAEQKKQAPAQAQQNVRRYQLVGKVVSVNKDQNSLVVDSQAIPGFMDAMTMPYPVRDVHLLEGLGAGDEITADVVVDNNGAYLDHIVVTKRGTGTEP